MIAVETASALARASAAQQKSGVINKLGLSAQWLVGAAVCTLS